MLSDEPSVSTASAKSFIVDIESILSDISGTLYFKQVSEREYNV